MVFDKIKVPFEWIGDKLTSLSSSIASYLSDKIGVSINDFTGMLISILILALAIFLISKIGKSTSKIIMIIVSILIAISLVTTVI